MRRFQPFYLCILLVSVLSFANSRVQDKRIEAVQRAVPEATAILGIKGIETVLKIFDQQAADTWGDSPTLVQGRLTLTSGTPVTVSDVTAASIVYYTPYNGNKIALYSGTAWQLLSFSELSVAVPATTNTNFDIFAYNNNGTVALETANWSTDTVRATELIRQDGVLCKTGALTRRYLGTGRTTSVSTQIENSDTKRYLWNYYNQIESKLSKLDSTDHSYGTSGAFRQYAGGTSNKVELVVGQAQLVTASIWQNHQSSTASIHCQAIVGYDSITSGALSEIGFGGINTGASYGSAVYPVNVGEGYHYLSMLYWVSGAYCVFYASNLLAVSFN